jgi:hypothetical protein
MKYQGPPPGYLTIEDVLNALKMTRQNFYQSGVADLLDFWQTKPNTPNLYAKEQISAFKYWLFIRQGLIALGIYKQNRPLANPHFESILDEDYHGYDCPTCEANAVVDDPMSASPKMWCPNCGIT